MINRNFSGLTEDALKRNSIMNLLHALGVITDKQRADLIQGSLLFRPGFYGFTDSGIGAGDDN